MSYPPYQQELNAIVASLTQDDTFLALLSEKLLIKLKAQTNKLQARIELLEYENRKLRGRVDDLDNLLDRPSLRTSVKANQSAPLCFPEEASLDESEYAKACTKKEVQQSNQGIAKEKIRVKDKEIKGYGQNQNYYGGSPYPSNSAPYPNTQQPPTTAPPGSGVYPASLGFRTDAPIYMPMPAGAMGYPPPPQTTSPYPSATPPHPKTISYTNVSSYSSSAPYPNVAPSLSSSTSVSSQNSAPYPSSAPYTSSAPYSNSAAYPSSTPYPATSSYPNVSSGSIYSTSGSAKARSPHRSPQRNANASYPALQQQSTASYPTLQQQSTATSGSFRQYTQPPHSSYPSGVSYQTNTVSSSYGGGGPYNKKTTPTVVPANPFNARGDAEILRKAMKGFGTDEKAIINIVSKRSNAQRLQIAVEFKTMYGKDLIKDLKSETSGNFEDLLVALMTPLPQYYAKELHDAIAGLGTDEDVLIEVLCTKSNNEIHTIRTAFFSMYGRPLEDDLIGDTSGTFKRLMVSICNACREESTGTNAAGAAKDAQDLLRAGELRLGTDESTFNMILCQRSFAQLRLVFDEYYRITGHDIETAIKNEFSGNSKDGLLAIVRSIRNQPGFFAKCLHDAIAGLGTNDRKLIRVVVTRCEIDMAEIKQNYLAQYGETLADAIRGDASGDYKRCLLALIGEF